MFLLLSDSLDRKLNINEASETKYPIQDDGSYVLSRIEHKASTHIQHWQLRDLLASPTKHTVLHPKRNALYMYNTKTKTDECYLENLSFTPISIHSKFGYIVMGGQTGMFMIKELSTGWVKQLSIGRGMNNSVFLSRNACLKTRVTICNNDQTVSILSVPEMENVQTLKMPSAINYCSTSPDGKKAVMVSDQGIAYLYTINKEGFYTDMIELSVSKEPSLSCAWNQSSDIFAVASQDGFVSVFHSETKQRLCQLGSVETRKTKKAPRSIQFSTGILDLLAYADHVSNIYIVDTRTFETRQVVRLSPENEDYAITGLTFSPNSRSLFVGLEDRLIELQIDTAIRRQFASGQLYPF